MQLKWLGNLLPNRMQGVERGHGFLKNHGHARTAQLAQICVAHGCELGAIEGYRSRDGGTIGQQSHDGQGGE